MASDSEDDFVAVVGRRKSSRPRKATLKQKLLDESESSDDDFVPVPRKKKASSDKKREVAGDSKATSQRLSRDEKLFNRDLKKALVESKSLSGQQEPATVSVSSPQESPSGSESEQASDFLPEDNSDSDEDFDPSPSSPPPNSRKNPTKRSTSKAKAPAKTAQKNQKQKAPSVKTSHQHIASNCKPLVRLQAVETSSLPGSKPAAPSSRRTAVCRPAPAPEAAITKDTNTAATAGRVKPTTTPAVAVKRRTKWVPPSKVDAKTAAGGCSASISSGGSPLGRVTGTGAPVIRVGLSRRAPIKPLHQTPLKAKSK